MRSLREPALRVLIVCALVATHARASEPAAVAPPAASAPAAITPERVRSIVADMRADPDFAGKHSERRLRWKRSDAPDPPPGKAPHWLADLARWLSEAGRGVMWLLGAIGVAVIAVFAWRWASVRADAVRGRAALLPSHVNDLDIRPESLPDDIAAAARTLWQRGEHRACLSLLYRGALSALVHDHGVAIRAASTEGECVLLVRRALPPEGSAFFERLVRAWQTEVYAGRTADAASVTALCAGFDAYFAAPAASARQTPQCAGAGA